MSHKIDFLHDVEFVAPLKDNFPNQYSALMSVWQKAADEVHPFQLGDTHQGTRHCTNVLQNIDKLVRDYSIELDAHESYVLACSAALHDLDKALVRSRRDSSYVHGVVSAKFIQQNSERLGLTPQIADAVGIVVHCHGKGALKTIQARRITDPQDFSRLDAMDISKLWPIFKLADMMDLSYRSDLPPKVIPIFKLVLGQSACTALCS